MASGAIFDADFEEIADRRRSERRHDQRRAPRQRFDPLFAATLVNHIARPEEVYADAGAYSHERDLLGIVVNLRA
jgi:hypothetical protein